MNKKYTKNHFDEDLYQQDSEELLDDSEWDPYGWDSDWDSELDPDKDDY